MLTSGIGSLNGKTDNFKLDTANYHNRMHTLNLQVVFHNCVANIHIIGLKIYFYE